MLEILGWHNLKFPLFFPSAPSLFSAMPRKRESIIKQKTNRCELWEDKLWFIQRDATLLGLLRSHAESNVVGQQSAVRNCACCVVSWEQGWRNRRVIVPSVIIPVGPPRLKLARALEGLKR